MSGISLVAGRSAVDVDYVSTPQGNVYYEGKSVYGPTGQLWPTQPYGAVSSSGANVAFGIDWTRDVAIMGGQVVTVSDTSTPVPNGVGNFTSVEPFPSISGTKVAFVAHFNAAGGSGSASGLYIFDGAHVSPVYDSTMPAPWARTDGAGTNFMAPRMPNDA